MRLFISVNFSPSVCAQFLEVQERLRALALQGNFTREENLHLTLAFLGEVPPGRLPAVRRAMESSGPCSLQLTFGHTGCFRRESSSLWWIGAQPNQALTQLQQALTGRLREEGFSLDQRRFTPHITLVREFVSAHTPDARAILPSPIYAHSDAIHLMLSERMNGRLTYTAFDSIL